MSSYFGAYLQQPAANLPSDFWALAYPRAYWGAYGASKAALDNLVLSYGQEVGNVSPVKVAIVDPGATATTMRARAFPGEDPATIKAPSAVAHR